MKHFLQKVSEAVLNNDRAYSFLTESIENLQYYAYNMMDIDLREKEADLIIRACVVAHKLMLANGYKINFVKKNLFSEGQKPLEFLLSAENQIIN